MAQDLQTNLILNDKQFTDGLRRAESGLASFGSKVKGLGSAIKSGLALGGFAALIGSVVDTVAEIHAATVRVNAGMGTFDDHWESSLSTQEKFLQNLPIIGRWMQATIRTDFDYDTKKIQWDVKE